MQQDDTTFIFSIPDARRAAEQSMENGAFTDAYPTGGLRGTVLKILDQVLASELVCVMRYKRHEYTAASMMAQSIAVIFHDHADEEWGHANQVAGRIQELGGFPDFNPATFADRSHSEYDDSLTLGEMVASDLKEERVAVETYTQIIRFLGFRDPTTRAMMESLLAKEEEHAHELANALDGEALGSMSL